MIARLIQYAGHISFALLARCGVLIFVTAAALALAEDKAKVELTGKKWIDMDYGPYTTHSFEAARPSGNIAYKGIKIRLGKNGETMVFDSDLLRWSAGWLDSELDWRSVVYDGSHNTHPHVLGDPVFANPKLPGWANKKQFNDPRPLPYGPLPRAHAHYKGLYLHGQQVILSYTVGGTKVLETAELERQSNVAALVRTIQIDKSPTDLLVQIAGDEESKATLHSIGNLEPSSDGPATSQLAIFEFGAADKKLPKVAADELEQGLVAHWTFDGDGKTVINNRGKTFAGTLESVDRIAGVKGQALAFQGKSRVVVADSDKINLGTADFTITAWVRTRANGTIAAKAPEKGKWAPKGKCLFVRGGKLGYDVGWVGVVQSRKSVADGQWHHVAVTYNHKDGTTKLFVDGEADGQRQLKSPDDNNHVFRFGYTATNFMPPLKGALDDVRLYDQIVPSSHITALAGTEAGVPLAKAVACIGAPAAVRFDVSDKSNIRLAIPASATPARFKILFWRGKPNQIADFSSLAKNSKPPIDLQPLTKGGSAQYAERLETKGKLGSGDKAYAIDTIEPPRDNPWRSWLRFGGFDFFSDANRAAICTWNGDVWIVDGIDGQLEKLSWRRIATGMFQPLGLKIIDDVIYVSCRDQITRLRDLNDDGEIDFYESFNNDHQVTEHFHEFAMDLQTDKEGNFYYAKSARHALDSVVPQHGTIIKVSADGKKSEIVCNGFRAANGVGVGPNGEIITSDQEGHWTPANRINLIKKGGFYGNMYSFHRGDRPKNYDAPLVWLPKNVDRSPAEQLWCTSDKWGPFKGKMIHTSYGTGQLWHVMYEHVDGVPQGGVVRFPLQFATGTMRARFHPTNGQLYVCGLVGWSSNMSLPGAFYRVRYTGKPVHMPTEMKVTDQGIYLTFTEPLDKKSAEDIDNYNVEQWNYRWTANYGSPHYSVADPKKRGQDEVEIFESTLSKDGKTIFLEIEDIEPVMQMQISYTLKAAHGKSFKDDIWLTINRLGKD